MPCMTRPAAQTHEYTRRINTVISHVRDNLNEALPLETLARVAGFSPFHFHRLFKSITGESVADMVMRLRLERAVMLLRSSPACTITSAAFASGFQSASVFSRTFKKHYGFSARSWDRHSPLQERKNSKVEDESARYTHRRLSNSIAHDEFSVQVQRLLEQRLAYIRVYDSYRRPRQLLAAYQRLLAWFCDCGGRTQDVVLYGMSQDDPDITPLRLCRFDWCVSVPATWQTPDDISVTTLPACTVATVRCVGDLALEERAFRYLFCEWLPNSRYQPANLPGMELYRQLPSTSGWLSFDMDCVVPIETL